MTAPPSRAVRRRPIVMGIGGLLLGLGVAFLLVHFALIALGTNAPLLVIATGGALGMALAYTLPPRQRKHRQPGSRHDDGVTRP